MNQKKNTLMAKKQTPKKVSFLKSRKMTTGFAVVALLGALAFINPGASPFSGNAVLKSPGTFALLPAIGALLLVCALILGLYSLRKK